MSLAQRLRIVSVMRLDDGCILWRGPTDRDGYGRLRSFGKRITAHRLSWMLHRGAIPAGLHVLHSCDEPACVAIEHLRLGTHAENMRDRGARGRTVVPVRQSGSWTGSVRRVG
jgi:hypothetical protein